MTASLLLQTLLRRSIVLVHWAEFRNPPPPMSAESDGDGEPQPDPPFWTYFIENPLPTSTDSNSTN